jgi:hypothetical protein
MAKSKAKRARGAVNTVYGNDYVKRLVEDEDLRDSIRDAFEAARDAYERLSSNGSVIDTAIDERRSTRTSRRRPRICAMPPTACAASRMSTTTGACC